MRKRSRKPEMPPEKDPAAVELGRRGGAKGGAVRASRLTAEQRRASAQRAARSRWGWAPTPEVAPPVDRQHVQRAPLLPPPAADADFDDLRNPFLEDVADHHLPGTCGWVDDHGRCGRPASEKEWIARDERQSLVGLSGPRSYCKPHWGYDKVQKLFWRSQGQLLRTVRAWGRGEATDEELRRIAKKEADLRPLYDRVVAASWPTMPKPGTSDLM